MLRKFFVILLLAALAGNAWAMGGAGQEPDPVEFNQDISAELSDIGGLVVKLNQVKVDGRSAFSGAMGNAQVVVPFAKINYAEFNAKGANFTAKIVLVDGQQITLELKKTTQLVGQANFGKYRINLGQILRIRFLH